MADKNVESGFPVDGGVNEQLAYLTKQITPAVMFSSDREINGQPVWSLMSDGSFVLNGAQVRSERQQGCFRALSKSLSAPIRKLLSLLR
ncbi:hypothetical protein [Pseudomonas sp.]|uniref:hypothetical protein n=1 Tax=Pseudomonas sp. TaxID=306 RepID=UPI00258AECF2|nr:hypothetical protein [Pseudomonas sp.]